MQKTYLILFFLWMTSFLFAQEGAEVVVILKEKQARITGTLVKEIPMQAVILKEQKTQEELIIEWDKIAELYIGCEPPKTEAEGSQMAYKSLPIVYKERGPYFHWVSSFGWGSSYRDFSFFTFHANVSGGYQFNKYVAVGGGFAHDYYPDVAFVGPLYGELRLGAMHKRMVPMLHLRAGYAVIADPTRIHNAFDAKQYLSLMLGYKEFTRRKYAWTYSVGLQKQWADVDITQTTTFFNPNTGQWEQFTYSLIGQVIINRLVWSWGILF